MGAQCSDFVGISIRTPLHAVRRERINAGIWYIPVAKHWGFVRQAEVGAGGGERAE